MSTSRDTSAPPRAAWPWWVAIGLYVPAVCLGHLAFSLWLVRGREITLLGHTHTYAFSFAVPWLAALAPMSAAFLLFSRFPRGIRSQRQADGLES